VIKTADPSALDAIPTSFAIRFMNTKRATWLDKLEPIKSAGESRRYMQ